MTTVTAITGIYTARELDALLTPPAWSGTVCQDDRDAYASAVRSLVEECREALAHADAVAVRISGGTVVEIVSAEDEDGDELEAYSYELYDSDPAASSGGEVKTGIIEASSREDAISSLRDECEIFAAGCDDGRIYGILRCPDETIETLSVDVQTEPVDRRAELLSALDDLNRGDGCLGVMVDAHLARDPDATADEIRAEIEEAEQDAAEI